MRLIWYGVLMRMLAMIAPVAGWFNSKLDRRNKGLKNQKVPILRQSIWIHAASLGEFEQGKKVIDGLRQQYPERSLVLTFFSSSGYDKRKNYPSVDHVLYLPYDTPTTMSVFVEKLDPALVVVIKYEFWFTWLSILKEKDIPYIFISAVFRPKQYFFKKTFEPFREVLRGSKKIFVQHGSSKRLLMQYGFYNVAIAGDTRIDRAIEICNESFSFPIIEQWKDGKFCVMAGSTWPAEEQWLGECFREYPEWKWVIAPHEIEPDHIIDIKNKFGGSAVTLSEVDAAPGTEWMESTVLIIDRIGILSRLYRYADIAYVGGGMGAGIHNTLEPAVYGLPVIFGPKYYKFQEAADFLELGTAISVASTGELNKALQVFSDKGTRNKVRNKMEEYFQKNSGATDLILHDIKSIL